MKLDNSEDEVSVYEIVEKFKISIFLILAKWKLVVFLSVLCALIGLGASVIIKPTYTAKVSFMVEEGEKSGGMLSGYASLASQFGIGGLGGGGSSFGPDNVMELLKSDKVITGALLSKIVVNKKTVLLANYFIETNKLRERWKLDNSLQKFSFPDTVKFENFNTQQDSVLLIIIENVSKKISIDKATKLSSILNLRYTSSEQNLSKFMAIELVKSVSDIYIQRKTSKSRKTLQDIQHRADSVRRELESTEFQLAKTKDIGRRVIMAVGSLNEAKLTRDENILSIMYAEIIKNLEITKMAISNQTPLIQLVDTPILPLKAEDKMPKKTGVVLGLILGIILACGYVILADNYRNRNKASA